MIYLLLILKMKLSPWKQLLDINTILDEIEYLVNTGEIYYLNIKDIIDSSPPKDDAMLWIKKELPFSILKYLISQQK
jgi:hypothetical protein